LPRSLTPVAAASFRGIGSASVTEIEAMMQNRYDRNHDREHLPGRREERETSFGAYNRDEDDWRYGEHGEQWRYGEHGDQGRYGERAFRANPRQDGSSREASGQNYPARWPSASSRFRDGDDDEYARSSWERQPRR
jgi:hypothetical protein